MKLAAILSLATAAVAASYQGPEGTAKTKFQLMMFDAGSDTGFVLYPITRKVLSANRFIESGFQYKAPSWQYDSDNGQLVTTDKSGNKFSFHISKYKFRDTGYTKLNVLPGAASGTAVKFAGVNGAVSESNDYLDFLDPEKVLALCKDPPGDDAETYVTVRTTDTPTSSLCKDIKAKAVYLTA